jgi:hypothetical protein
LPHVLYTDTLSFSLMSDIILKSLEKLEDYCRKESFKGYDPYDGLNSSLFKAIPFLPGSRIARLAWIQLFKRLPFNLRRLAGIRKEYNPKALGLFLSGYCNLYRNNPGDEYLDMIRFFCEKIRSVTSSGYSGACWGYNFPWQAKAFYQPEHTPTVVATTFISTALLDAYEITGDMELLTIARSSCDFILKDLNRTYDKEGNFAFSYSPLDHSVVFNASLLGSRLLSRTYKYTKEELLIEEAGRSVAFCCGYQQSNGSWSYGTFDFHKWVDNFHTGYNLECISDYTRYSGDNSFSTNLTKGLD